MSPMKLEKLLLCFLKFNTMSPLLNEPCVDWLLCFLAWVKEGKWIKTPLSFPCIVQGLKETFWHSLCETGVYFRNLLSWI